MAFKTPAKLEQANINNNKMTFTNGSQVDTLTICRI